MSNVVFVYNTVYIELCKENNQTSQYLQEDNKFLWNMIHHLIYLLNTLYNSYLAPCCPSDYAARSSKSIREDFNSAHILPNLSSASTMFVMYSPELFWSTVKTSSTSEIVISVGMSPFVPPTQFMTLAELSKLSLWSASWVSRRDCPRRAAAEFNTGNLLLLWPTIFCRRRRLFGLLSTAFVRCSDYRTSFS